MSRYHYFKHTDPGQWKRKLTPEQAQRVVELREKRRLSFNSIAAWFTRNGVSIDYRVAQRAYRWVRS